jgi:membrane associated rhomboid family serine protease
MFALWMFGASLENVWGPKKFLIFYLITGIGAALVHYALFYFQMSPVIDAINAYISQPSEQAFNVFKASHDLVRTDEVVNYYNTIFLPHLRAATSDAQSVQATIDFLSFYKVAYLNAPNIVGASGAVFGILLGFGMMFPNSLIYVYFAIPVKAKWFVTAYGAIELYTGIRNNPGDNVAHFAHLGGMVFGLLLILYWKKKGKLFTSN